MNFLPETCEYCGSPTEVVETLSTLQCSNPKCSAKLGSRLYAMLQDLGINLMTFEDCISFIDEFEAESPYTIFLYNPNNDGELFEGFGEDKSNQLYKELNKKRGMLLWEYVSIGNFDDITSSLEKILRNYSNLFDFYDDLSDEGIPFIQSLLLEGTEYEKQSVGLCIDAVLLFEFFVRNKEELEKGLEGVVIIDPEIKMSVLFANDVTEFRSNRDFLYWVNKKLKNKIYLYPVYSLSSNVDLLYWEDLGINTHNTLVEKVQTELTGIKIIDKENIFNVLLEVIG